jgi:hypothetical protein
MRPFRVIALAFLASGALALALGCGGGDKPKGGDGGGPKADAGGQDTGSGPRTALEAKEWTTLKGKVVYDGDPPKDDGSLKKQMSEHNDKNVCLEGDTAEFTWRVNPDNKGVQNVVIWVEPPDGKYFKPNTPNEAVWKKDDVKFDQPHCAFEPHVAAAFISYYDGKGQQKTGQKVMIHNSAPVTHNTKWSGNTRKNPGDSPTIQAKSEKEMAPLQADPQTVVGLACDIHKWMRGYLWALDTPYFAVTDKNGEFEIKDVPAGSEVHVVKWHEATQFLDGGAKGTKTTLKSGTHDLGEIKIKAK